MLQKTKKKMYIVDMDAKNKIKPDKSAQKQAAAEIVRDARRQCGFTQQQFADALGVTWQYISRIENGRCIPSAKIMQGVAKVLSEKGIPSAVRSPAEADLIDVYRELPTKARLAVDSIVSVFKEK
jgi:transcriptional regulator with XRE-family HTH domain